MPRDDINSGTLQHLYTKKLLSKREISIRLKCHISTIHKKMIIFNIPARKQDYASRIAMSKKIIKLKKTSLEKLYLGKKLSVSEIARKLNLDRHTVKRELIRHKIPFRSKKRAIQLALSKKKIPIGVLEKLYIESHLTQKQISEKLGKSRGYILHLMKVYRIPTRNVSQTQIQYPKYDFSGNLLEKSYLIGFRTGDLSAKLSPSRNLILVYCTSTKRVQIQLFKNLFKKYGHVWVSKARKDKNKVFMVRLNRTFNFLLPKKDNIPTWILENDKNILSFIAGYTDAEGSIGVFNNLARFTLASYDKNILKFIYKRLNYIGIPCNPPRILVKKGYITSRGHTYRNDHWSFTIVKKSSLILLFKILEPYLKHEKRIVDIQKARINILERNLKLGNTHNLF